MSTKDGWYNDEKIELDRTSKDQLEADNRARQLKGALEQSRKHQRSQQAHLITRQECDVDTDADPRVDQILRFCAWVVALLWILFARNAYRGITGQDNAFMQIQGCIGLRIRFDFLHFLFALGCTAALRWIRLRPLIEADDRMFSVGKLSLTQEALVCSRLRKYRLQRRLSSMVAWSSAVGIGLCLTGMEAALSHLAGTGTVLLFCLGAGTLISFGVAQMFPTDT